MHPKLINFPDVGSYSALFLLGFFFAYLLARWQARQLRIAGRHIDNLTLLILVFSLAGARFFSWLFYNPNHISLWEAFAQGGAGGLVFYGGFVFAFLTLFVYSLIFKVQALVLADVMAPGVALGLAFGRVGCFLGGCCWGDICAPPSQLDSVTPPQMRYQIQTFPRLSPGNLPLAVQFPKGSDIYKQHRTLGLLSGSDTRSLPVHPVQLYEAGLAAALAVFLSWAFRKPHLPGDTLWALGIGYGSIRFFLEFLRADNRPNYWGMTISQVISIIIVMAFLGIFFINRRPRQLSP